MASLRGARCAFAPRWHQPLGCSVSPLRASLRPHLGAGPRLFAQHRVGARSLQIAAYAETAIQFTQDCLIHMHATGWPWFAAIPAAAVAVAVARMPLQYIAKEIVRRQSEAGPLIEAWKGEIYGTRLQGAIQLARHRKRILRDRKAQDWKAWAPALGLPVWFLMSESIRRLCGAGGGLVSLITGSYRDAAKPAADGAASVSEQTATALSSSIDAASNGLQSVSSVVDLGLTTGGVGWFTDLTASDPYMILPAALSATMLYSFLPSNPEMRDLVLGQSSMKTASLAPGMLWRVRLTRGLLVSSVVMGVVCSQLPAGLFLYWIPSMVASQLLGKLVMDTDKARAKALKPCKNRETLILRPV